MRWSLYPATEFARFATAWDQTNAACRELPFLRAAFLEPLLHEFGTGDELLAICEAGHTAIAFGLLAKKRHGTWETFQPSQLPLAAWLFRSGHDIDMLLPALLERLPGFALHVGITQQDPLALERPVDRPRLRTLDYVRTAWVDIEGTFDDYWSARGKNLRANMRKQRAKLESDGVSTCLEVVTSPNEVSTALAEYGVLESCGWKAAGGTAIHPDNAQGRFYRAMLEKFFAQGLGRIYRYKFGDKVVAIDLCIEGGGTLVILKTTYDESLTPFSPALLMRQAAFKSIFDASDIKRVEFYGKLMDWHTRWTSSTRTLYHINYYRWPWLPSIRPLFYRIAGKAQQPRPEAS